MHPPSPWGGRCVWGLGLRSRALGTCFAEKSVRRFVPPICWDFFADFGGGGARLAPGRCNEQARFHKQPLPSQEEPSSSRWHRRTSPQHPRLHWRVAGCLPMQRTTFFADLGGGVCLLRWKAGGFFGAGGVADWTPAKCGGSRASSPGPHRSRTETHRPRVALPRVIRAGAPPRGRCRARLVVGPGRFGATGLHPLPPAGAACGRGRFPLQADRLGGEPPPPPPPRYALEGKGPQRRLGRRLGRRLEEVARAVGGGYCRLQMPLRLALGVRGTVAGHRLGAREEGGVPPPLLMHPCSPPPPASPLRLCAEVPMFMDCPFMAPCCFLWPPGAPSASPVLFLLFLGPWVSLGGAPSTTAETAVGYPPTASGPRPAPTSHRRTAVSCRQNMSGPGRWRRCPDPPSTPAAWGGAFGSMGKTNAWSVTAATIVCTPPPRRDVLERRYTAGGGGGTPPLDPPPPAP